MDEVKQDKQKTTQELENKGEIIYGGIEACLLYTSFRS